MFGSVFFAWISPTVTFVCFIEISGFFFSHSVICSSRKFIAPGCSFVKKVLTPVIRSPVAAMAGLGLDVVVTTCFGASAFGISTALLAPKSRGECEMPLSLAPAFSRGIGLSGLFKFRLSRLPPSKLSIEFSPEKRFCFRYSSGIMTERYDKIFDRILSKVLFLFLRTAKLRSQSWNFLLLHLPIFLAVFSLRLLRISQNCSFHRLLFYFVRPAAGFFGRRR